MPAAEMASSKSLLRRLLVANRAEIAVRILQTARELGLETYAIYSPEDDAHASAAHHAVKLPSSAAYTDIKLIAEICHGHKIDHVHPGYGFLSESAEFSRFLGEQGITVIGPGWQVLDRTGDKLKAKTLARECNVPLLPSMLWEDSSKQEWDGFIRSTGYPVLFKLADGGGGRGIRIVHHPSDLEATLERAKRDGGRFFVEKAAIEGYHHIEVQIIGDGKGGVRHLWERDCSIQRKFQKIVEVAPGRLHDRGLLGKVTEAALRVAKHVNYYSLGTFEFLVNDQTSEFFFLEINPRIQVEHTISESIASLDLVRIQLQLAQGISLSQLPDLDLLGETPSQPPPGVHSIQLRVCAEDPANNFGLSIGKITGLKLPSGNGIRVDTHIQGPTIVSSDFDNLLAKIIVTARSWESCVAKAKRSLEDTFVAGVKTNLGLLRGIISHPDFLSGKTDTQWLERKLAELLHMGEGITASLQEYHFSSVPLVLTGGQDNLSASSRVETVMLRPNDAWSVSLTPQTESQSDSATHHLRLDRITFNQFPDVLNGLLTHTTSESEQQYQVQLKSTSLSASQATSSGNLRKGDAGNPNHIVAPLAGRLVELRVEEDDCVNAGDVVAYVRQMKMEIEVRSSQSGRVVWALNPGEENSSHGIEVVEGTLLLELDRERGKTTAKL